MISELIAKCQLGVIHTADLTDDKVNNRASVPPNLKYSAVYTCPWREKPALIKMTWSTLMSAAVDVGRPVLDTLLPSLFLVSS